MIKMQNFDKETDILIIGGGIAGIACAYIAGKNGLKTALIEEKDYLGGLITGGLVVPMMHNDSQNINQEFLFDLINYSKKYNAQIEYGDGNPFWFHPIKLKKIFLEMLEDVGCEIFFNSKILSVEKNNKNIKCVNINQKTLSLHFYSKYYIDGTGSGNFSKILGCEFLNDAQDKKQALSLRFIMSGVDSKELAEFLLDYDKDRDTTTAYEINNEYYLSTAYTWDTTKKWGLKPLFDKAIKDKILNIDDSDYFQIFSIAGEPSSIAFNCPRLKCDNKDIDKAINEGKKAIKRLEKFVKLYIKGFGNAYVSHIADMLGIRESGRVRCKYTFEIKDIINENTPESPILHSNYPIDIHSEKQNQSVLRKNCGYYLPIESLMSYDFDNLFVIGRCLGASFEAQASLRIQPNCASMGEGVAKYIKLHLE